MGNWGLPESLYNWSLNSTPTGFKNLNDTVYSYNQYNNVHNSQLTSQNLDVCVESVYHGIDWIYNISSVSFAFKPKVFYFQFLNSIFDDSFDFYFNTTWYFILLPSTFQLFWSTMLDLYTTSNLFKFHFLDEWFKFFLSSRESSVVYIYHPELILIKNFIFNEFYNMYFTNFRLSIYDGIDQESFRTPLMLLPQLLILLYTVFLFISFYFSYYFSSVKEESTIDSDYLAASVTIESEKELGSIDDMLLCTIVIVYIFGWYFYVHCWSLLSVVPELLSVFYLLPVTYYIIFSIPTYLSYDFGIFFLGYLRGVGPSPVLIAELMYDYIAFVAFYIRLMVQGVRLVLMIFTYTSMHDLIIFFSYDQQFMLGSENIWENISNFSVSFGSFSYLFLFELPITLLYWAYELIHTFFVLTAQTVAFFAMVFWLFLFLYSFFVFEKIENHFKTKRIQRKNIYNNLYSYKN